MSLKDKLLKIISPLIKVIAKDIKKNTDDIVQINERLDKKEEDSKIEYKPKIGNTYMKPDYTGQILIVDNNKVYISINDRHSVDWLYLGAFVKEFE